VPLTQHVTDHPCAAGTRSRPGSRCSTTPRAVRRSRARRRLLLVLSFSPIRRLL